MNRDQFEALYNLFERLRTGCRISRRISVTLAIP
jgi:hypothetical protein